MVSDAGAFQDAQLKKPNKTILTDTAAAAVRAGCNVELTWSKGVYGYQKDALATGQLSEDDVRNNVKAVLTTRMRLGEFDPPMMSPFRWLHDVSLYYNLNIPVFIRQNVSDVSQLMKGYYLVYYI